MRQLTLLLLALPLLGALACASASPLPGGPPDAEPPVILGFNPDSGAVNFRGSAVVVEFDETISDRGTGATALEALIAISPRAGEPRIRWSRNRIAIRPRDGFLPNTAYRITVRPGIADIRGNRSSASTSIVISTGPTIPNGAITGLAFDWPGQSFARDAEVEAIRLADSAVFAAPIDSAGSFTVAPLNPGAYLVYAYVDQNRNRIRDRTEAWDSTRVTVGDTVVAVPELLLAPRDTFPARLQNVSIVDSVTLAIEFDKPLDPAQAFTTAQVRVVRQDSTPLTVAALMTRAAYDSVRRAAADTARREPVPVDTVRRDTVPADTIARDTLAVDTVPPRTRPSRPAPPRAFVVVLREPLQPGTSYRITVTGFRSLMGRADTFTRTITVPVARPPAEQRDSVPATPPPDTTRIPPPDTTRVPPPDTTRTPPSRGPRR